MTFIEACSMSKAKPMRNELRNSNKAEIAEPKSLVAKNSIAIKTLRFIDEILGDNWLFSCN